MFLAGALADVDALEDATASFHWCWELRTLTGLPKAAKQHADAVRKHRKQVGACITYHAATGIVRGGARPHTRTGRSQRLMLYLDVAATLLLLFCFGV